MVDKYVINQLTYNLKRPGGKINVGDDVMVATLSFKFDARSQMTLEAASNIVQFYNKFIRYITNIMI